MDETGDSSVPARELLLELGEDLRPTGQLPNSLAMTLSSLTIRNARRAALAGQLIEDRPSEIAGPVALLVGLLELGRVLTSIQVTCLYSGEASQLALYLFFHAVHGWQSQPPT